MTPPNNGQRPTCVTCRKELSPDYTTPWVEGVGYNRSQKTWSGKYKGFPYQKDPLQDPPPFCTKGCAASYGVRCHAEGK